MNRFLPLVLVTLVLLLNSCSERSEYGEASDYEKLGAGSSGTDETTTSSSSSGVFVAVGLSGNIIRSTDNGSSWDNVTSPTSNDLWEVGFSE